MPTYAVQIQTCHRVICWMLTDTRSLKIQNKKLTPCRLMDMYRRFGSILCLNIYGIKKVLRRVVCQYPYRNSVITGCPSLHGKRDVEQPSLVMLNDASEKYVASIFRVRVRMMRLQLLHTTRLRRRWSMGGYRRQNPVWANRNTEIKLYEHFYLRIYME